MSRLAGAAPRGQAYLYVLKLRGGRMYVGSTGNLAKRVGQHKKGTGSAWTRRFPVQSVVSATLVAKAAVHAMETATTKQMMGQHGVHMVRGGAFSEMVLSDATVEVLSRELRHDGNRCFSCGGTGHYVQRCPEKAVVAAGARVRPGARCSRCGRANHAEEDCFASTSVDGEPLFDADSELDSDSEGTDPGYPPGSCRRCGRRGHGEARCYARTDVHGSEIEDVEDAEEDESGDDYDSGDYDSDGVSCCQRCGRRGHTASTCYARTNVNGKFLRR